MKNKRVQELNLYAKGLLVVIGFAAVITSCSKEDPVKEDAPELITEAVLTFNPTTGGGTTVVVTATDPDGEGVQDISADGPINLQAGVQYVLTIELHNTLAGIGQPGYNITDEVEEEGEEHLFLFSWTGPVFQIPTGDGNIDNRADAVSYADLDDGGLPVGLITTWTTAGSAGAGTFRILLKHQPGLKTSTSGSTIGETDLDLTFTINVL